jgi:hypothetical protein
MEEQSGNVGEAIMDVEEKIQNFDTITDEEVIKETQTDTDRSNKSS